MTPDFFQKYSIDQFQMKSSGLTMVKITFKGKWNDNQL